MGPADAPHGSPSDRIPIEASGVDQVFSEGAKTHQALANSRGRERARRGWLACARSKASGPKIGDEAVYGLRIHGYALERAGEGDQVFYRPAVGDERIAAQAANIEVGEERACHIIGCTAREPSRPPRLCSRWQLLRSAGAAV